MRISWKEYTGMGLIIAGAVVVFARLESYSWWLIGSWKGALGVLAVVGLGILFTNIRELIRLADISTLTETLLWLVTATAVIGSLLSTTTRLEFGVAAGLIGLSWAAQFGRHLWVASHDHTHRPHFIPLS